MLNWNFGRQAVRNSAATLLGAESRVDTVLHKRLIILVGEICIGLLHHCQRAIAIAYADHGFQHWNT